MNRRGFSITCTAAALCLLSTADVLAQPGSDVEVVKAWLDRMNEAVATLNYRGSFVHGIAMDDLENLEIVHRYANGEERERICSTDGMGREILRTPHSVRSVFPDKRLVVIEEPEVASLPTASVVTYTTGLESYYDLTSYEPRGQIAGRDTHVVSIRPRDQYRYGYLLWLDRATALPLKSQVRDERNDVVEEILFTSISVVDSIPEEDVATGIDTTDFEIRRPDKNNHAAASSEIWAATRLPNGFTLSVSRSTLLAGSAYPVQHLVYSDGLATVSVFIAHPLSDADMPEGYSRAGSTNAYARKIDGRLVVAVGEVPRLTVHRIANSLDAL